ncbi:hypothetical protein SynSYN20_00089 [Synechococcus sp. SYN20]|nr:hypothetical protein SynSYN20_00089 [Synechococcus sp. SYN20]
MSKQTTRNRSVQKIGSFLSIISARHSSLGARPLPMMEV